MLKRVVESEKGLLEVIKMNMHPSLSNEQCPLTSANFMNLFMLMGLHPTSLAYFPLRSVKVATILGLGVFGFAFVGVNNAKIVNTQIFDT